MHFYITRLLLVPSLCWHLVIAHRGLPRTTREGGWHRIIGGENATEDMAAYQVSLQLGNLHICGGIILADRWILTAAQCVKETGFTLYAGSHDLAKITNAQKLSPLHVYVHCRYDNPLFANDIALIRTREIIHFSKLIKPIEMDADFVPPGETLTLTGWGATKNGNTDAEQEYANYLQMLDFRAVGHKECNQAWQNDGGVHIGSLCGYNDVNKGACCGDFGSPVLYNGKLVGMASYVLACARGIPDVFASIAYHYDFIRTTISTCKPIESLLEEGRQLKAHRKTINLQLLNNNSSTDDDNDSTKNKHRKMESRIHRRTLKRVRTQPRIHFTNKHGHRH